MIRILVIIIAALTLLSVTEGSLLYAEHSKVLVRDGTIKDQNDKIDLVTADRDRQLEATKGLVTALKNQQAEMDRVAADAQQSQDQALAQITSTKVALANTAATLDTLRSAAREAKPENQTKALSPFAVTGIEWLRCKQEAARTGTDPVTCAGKVRLPAH